jgi:replicative DNA helicase
MSAARRGKQQQGQPRGYPADPQAERWTLAHILLEQDEHGGPIYRAIAGMLEPGDYDTEEYADLFAAMQRLHAKGAPVNSIPALTDELGTMGESRRSAQVRVIEISQFLDAPAPTLPAATYNAGIVLKHSLARRRLKIADDLATERVSNAEARQQLAHLEARVARAGERGKGGITLRGRRPFPPISPFSPIGSTPSHRGQKRSTGWLDRWCAP